MKYLTALLISFLTTVTIAQNVPNGNFENWDTEDFFVTNDWVSYGKPHRSSESMTGQYAITLENYETSPNTYNSSSIYNVDWIDGEVDKFPYDGDPLSMVFYANYNLASGDSAYLESGFYEKGRWIGDAKIKVTGTSNGSFLKYSVPITWYGSRTPDSVYIGMRSLSHQGNANGYGFITIDDFHYENIGNRTVDVNNHDFENWTNEGVVYPNKWMSIDLVAFRSWGGFLRNPSVVETDRPFRGSNSLIIQNFESWNNPDAGFCFTGTANEDAWRPSFPVDKKYKYLQGYYKYTNGGGDSAEVSLNMFVAGNYLGDGTIRFGATTNGWQFFSIPVNYYVDIKPDSATIRLFSAIEGSSKSLTTVLEIDELEFVDELNNTLNTDDKSFNQLSVYPNPFTDNINFSSQSGNYQLYSSNGQMVQSGDLNIGENKINLTSLSSGCYYIKTQDINHKQWQKKIIKR